MAFHIKAQDLMSDFFLVIMSLVVGTCGYWFFGDTTIPFVTQISQTLPPLVAQGETISRTYQMQYEAPCEATIVRNIIDQKTNQAFDLESTHIIVTKQMVGKSQPFSFTVKIPPNAPPDKYEYHANITFACNPLQRLVPGHLIVSTIPFEVIEKK